LLSAFRETTNLFAKTQVLPHNLVIQNLLEMLEKMSEEVDQDNDRDVKNLTLLNQGTLRMSHSKICILH
jgi:hypothetical protein